MRAVSPRSMHVGAVSGTCMLHQPALTSSTSLKSMECHARCGPVTGRRVPNLGGVPRVACMLLLD